MIIFKETDGLKISISGLCCDQKAFIDVLSLPPKKRLEIFSQSKKITTPTIKLDFKNSKTKADAGEQKCLF